MVWTHIILEGYCLFDISTKKKHVSYRVIDIKTLKTDKKKIIRKNENYIPPSERPNWCIKQNKKRIPQFRCLCYGKDKRCPFFAMTNADKPDYKFLAKKYELKPNELKNFEKLIKGHRKLLSTIGNL